MFSALHVRLSPWNPDPNPLCTRQITALGSRRESSVQGAALCSFKEWCLSPTNSEHGGPVHLGQHPTHPVSQDEATGPSYPSITCPDTPVLPSHTQFPYEAFPRGLGQEFPVPHFQLSLNTETPLSKYPLGVFEGKGTLVWGLTSRDQDLAWTTRTQRGRACLYMGLPSTPETCVCTSGPPNTHTQSCQVWPQIQCPALPNIP